MLGLTDEAATLLKEHYPELCKRIAALEAELLENGDNERLLARDNLELLERSETAEAKVKKLAEATIQDVLLLLIADASLDSYALSDEQHKDLNEIVARIKAPTEAERTKYWKLSETERRLKDEAKAEREKWRLNYLDAARESGDVLAECDRLREYTEHKQSCLVHTAKGDTELTEEECCTCGLSAALRGEKGEDESLST